MAIVNPTPADFVANQERALDYQQYRSTSDVLRAVAEFYKISVFKETTEDKLNYVTTGLRTIAVIDNDKIQVTVTEGGGVFDNQPLYFTNDFIFEIDKPDTDKTYYVYLYYKYVEEYPPNYAYIRITDVEQEDVSYHLIARVYYHSDDDSVSVDLSPRDQLISDEVGDDGGSGGLYPIYIANDSEVSSNNLYFVDTSSGPVTLTLTNNPENNDVIAFYDMKGTFNQNPLTIVAPTGFTVHGQTSLVVSDKYAYVYLQILDPNNDTNWYKLYDVAEVYDNGEY